MIPSAADAYAKATQHTAANLKTILAAQNAAHLSHLTLPEVEVLTEQIAQVIPAGNVPGLILNGLIRLEGREVPRAEQQRHLTLLFRGMRELMDKAIYGAVFAGPAAVILGYQKLLQLAGKNVEAAFPEGTWQFYLEYALREDTARHANETTGFQHLLAVHHLTLNAEEVYTAWIMAALVTLRHYERLLENEWRERVYLRLLTEAAADQIPEIHGAYAAWERQRPYMRGQDAGQDDYPTYRRRRFDAYFQTLLGNLSAATQAQVTERIEQANRESLPAYIRQMQILARLEPGQYQETRTPYDLAQASLGVVWQGLYYLLPVLQANGIPTDITDARQFTATLLRNTERAPACELDLLLAGSERASQPTLRAMAGQREQQALNALRYMPIILNWDRCDARLPLSVIRQGHRGIGDHALTLFFTEDSTVFDQSHIFFDGAGGAALAEIMTAEALSWAQFLVRLPPVTLSGVRPMCLPLRVTPKLQTAAARVRRPAEAAAESTAVRLASAMALRRLFKTRNDLINVTINDLLILYRAIHGQRYQPSLFLIEQLEQLRTSNAPGHRQIAVLIEEAIGKVQHSNPAILIPIDASQASPGERLYPTTFRNPMHDLLTWHNATLAALWDYRSASGDRATQYARFDDNQRHYLRMIAAFGALMRKYKEIVLAGRGMSTMSIKLLAHIPAPVQHLLEEIPGQFDVLNEILKGEEVFSNVGRVAKGSTLRRFITAKDDNRQKTLAWGVITDDNDVMHISLRDFRPHVTVLHESGMSALATRITQDFLDSYVDGLNLFVRELRDITVASRETRSRSRDKDDNP